MLCIEAFVITEFVTVAFEEFKFVVLTEFELIFVFKTFVIVEFVEIILFKNVFPTTPKPPLIVKAPVVNDNDSVVSVILTWPPNIVFFKILAPPYVTNELVVAFKESVVSKISTPDKKVCWSYDDILFIIIIQNKITILN